VREERATKQQQLLPSYIDSGMKEKKKKENFLLASFKGSFLRGKKKTAFSPTLRRREGEKFTL